MTEWNAEGYARISGLQKMMAAEALSLLRLTGDERILDVGCGEGAITSEIAARVPQGAVVGVDASRDMIRFARTHFPSAAHANLRFDVADARTLPFANEFDLVVSFNALHWIPDQDAALRSILRAMKPRARAILRLVPAGERKSLEMVVEDTRKSARWRNHFAGFLDPYLRLNPEDYRRTAERNGLHVVAIRTALKEWDFGRRDAFEAFCRVGLVAWTSRLAEQDRDGFVADALDRYAALSPSGLSAPQIFFFYQMDVDLCAPQE
jgi:trans-aconitate 2-methyltransferase